MCDYNILQCGVNTYFNVCQQLYCFASDLIPKTRCIVRRLCIINGRLKKCMCIYSVLLTITVLSIMRKLMKFNCLEFHFWHLIIFHNCIRKAAVISCFCDVSRHKISAISYCIFFINS